MKLDPVLDVPVKWKPALAKTQSGRPVQVTERKLYSDAWAQVTRAVTFSGTFGVPGTDGALVVAGAPREKRVLVTVRQAPEVLIRQDGHMRRVQQLSRGSVDQLRAFGGGGQLVDQVRQLCDDRLGVGPR